MLKNAPMLTYDKKSKQPRGLGRGAYRGMGKNLLCDENVLTSFQVEV